MMQEVRSLVIRAILCFCLSGPVLPSCHWLGIKNRLKNEMVQKATGRGQEGRQTKAEHPLLVGCCVVQTLYTT